MTGDIVEDQLILGGKALGLIREWRDAVLASRGEGGGVGRLIVAHNQLLEFAKTLDQD